MLGTSSIVVSIEGGFVGSVIKKRRKRMAKKKHRKLLRKTRVQRRNKKLRLVRRARSSHGPPSDQVRDAVIRL
jgi:hypothetical protein